MIFAVCHFSAGEKREFTRLYQAAHPKKQVGSSPERPVLTVQLPDLGDEEKNRKLLGLVSGFVRQVVKLIDEDNGREKRR